MADVVSEKEYPSALADFTRPDCDRFQYIKSFLEAHRTLFTVIPVEECRFIHVAPATHAQGLASRPLFTAHYDRAPSSPGANDNSAAVLQLLFFITTRDRGARLPAGELLFTDHEETARDASPRTQGSFRLGELLKKKGGPARVFFHFDMCGRGDTIILSEAGERLLERRKKTRTPLYQKIKSLRSFFTAQLEQAFPGRVLSLPTPFSDNLGFLLQGFPVLQFTLLPKKEALAFQSDYRKLLDELSGLRRRRPETAEEYRTRFAAIQPPTWRLRHTSEDDAASLTPEAFPLMRGLLTVLAGLKIPAL